MTQPTTPAPADPALRERVARALLTVQLHIGPNAIATAQSGRPIRLSGGEADRAAAVVLAELAPELTRAERAEIALTQVRAILADLTDPDPCWYDHHGYCQAHGWFATTPACPHARAKALTGPAEENTP